MGDLMIASSDLPGRIYLYGEQHGVDKIMDKEFSLWFDYYHNENMRHLFIEKPYYTAEFLNLWMQADSDDILNTVYEDWVGTLGYNPSYKEFFKRIKRECFETIFHSTDIGHQYETTGQRFLKYLEENGLKGTEKYMLVEEVIEQGRFYYRDNSYDHAYRERMMVENFIREFDSLSNKNIMGIYGSAHTGLDATIGSILTMANQLKERYGDAIYSENLSWLALDIDPYRIDTLIVNGKEYEASYFGKQDLTGLRNFAYREYWRPENSYVDFKDMPIISVLPYGSMLQFRT